MHREKILLFGKNGQVGKILHKDLPELGDVIAFGQQEANFLYPEQIAKLIRSINPSLIINAAAYNAVDQAEIEQDKVFLINAKTPGAIAHEAAHMDALFVHYSTDMVFDGVKNSLYTEEDIPNPVNAYGRSKLAGEEMITQAGCKMIIFRTSWVYSRSGDNFVTRILKLSRKEKELNIVTDQKSSPTWAGNIASATINVLEQVQNNNLPGTGQSGVYHICNFGTVSKYDWAKVILDLDPAHEEQIVERINPVKSDYFPMSAPRPIFSGLDTTRFEKVFDIQLPDWMSTFTKVMKETNLL